MKKLLIFLILIGLGLAGLAWWLSYERHKPLSPDSYTFAPVEYGRISEVVSATGVVQPREVFPVGTELSGKVVAVLADFNQTVSEGDPLVRLDDRMARDRLRQAELAVRLARVQVRQAETDRDAAQRFLRHERERSPDVRNQTQLDMAQSKYENARVAIDAAKLKVQEAEEAQKQAELGLSLTTVRVPVLQERGSASHQHLARPGVGTLAPPDTRPQNKRPFIVLDRKVSLNQLVGPPASAQLFTLAGNLDRMLVQAHVVEGDVVKIRRGLKADFTVAGTDNGPTFHGTVEEVRLVPTSERGAVFYNVMIDVANQKDGSGNWVLRPGQTASVDIVRRVHEHVWKLPTAALNAQPDPSLMTPAARARIARWQDRKDRDQWRIAWVLGPENKPWPVFARTGGQAVTGESGLSDGQFTEVMEWDPELKPRPEPNDRKTYPRVIIGMPAPKKGGLFSAPNVKF